MAAYRADLLLERVLLGQHALSSAQDTLAFDGQSPKALSATLDEGNALSGF